MNNESVILSNSNAPVESVIRSRCTFQVPSVVGKRRRNTGRCGRRNRGLGRKYDFRFGTQHSRKLGDDGAKSERRNGSDTVFSSVDRPRWYSLGAIMTSPFSAPFSVHKTMLPFFCFHKSRPGKELRPIGVAVLLFFPKVPKP